MITRRFTSLFEIGLFVMVFSMAVSAHVGLRAQPTVEQIASGIGQQQQGNIDDKIKLLRAAVKQNKNDLTAWKQLGLALEQKGETNDARKAYEKAAKLGDELLADQLENVTSGAEFSSRLTPLASKLAESATSAEKYLQLANLSGKKLQEWKLRADSLRAFAEVANDPTSKPAILSPKDVTVKARVISKPEPQYTEDARQAQITGLVILRAIFASNGRVVGIRVVKGLSHGLNERSVQAARKIKFIPALKNGRPVSMYIQLEYSFNLY